MTGRGGDSNPRYRLHGTTVFEPHCLGDGNKHYDLHEKAPRRASLAAPGGAFVASPSFAARAIAGCLMLGRLPLSQLLEVG
jgi:hypothetical protein